MKKLLLLILLLLPFLTTQAQTGGCSITIDQISPDVCQGQRLLVSFKLPPNCFIQGIFTAEVSQQIPPSPPNFATPLLSASKDLATINLTKDTSIILTFPVNFPPGLYGVRVGYKPTISSPVYTIISNVPVIEVKPIIPGPRPRAIVRVDNIKPRYCPTDTIRFIVDSLRFAGANPTFRWFRCGTPLKDSVNSSVRLTNFTENCDVCMQITKTECAEPDSNISALICYRVLVFPKPLLRLNLAPGSTGCELTQNTFIARADSAGPNPLFKWVVNGDTVRQGINDTVFTYGPAQNVKFNDTICVVLETDNCRFKSVACYNIRACGQVFLDPPFPDSVCAGTGFKVPYTIRGTFNQGNRFSVQLSGVNGSFANPVEIGFIDATQADTIRNVIIPASTPPGNCYRIRIISTSPRDTSDTSACIKINPRPDAPAVRGDTTCGPGFVSLRAFGNVGNETFVWYRRLQGINPIHFGATFTLFTNKDTTVYVAVRNASGCESARVPVTGRLFAPPIVDAGVYQPLCPESNPVNLVGATSGGISCRFLSTTGVNTTNNTFSPIGLAPGQYAVIYSCTTAVGCVANDTSFIEVRPAPPGVNAGPDRIICITNPPLQLTGAPAGGTWTGSGVTAQGLFVPSSGVIGENVVVYSFVGSNGCVGRDTAKINLRNAPTFQVNVVNNVNCGDSAGIATLTNLVPFSGIKVLWGTTPPDSISFPSKVGLKSGAYNVKVTDTIAKCSTTQPFAINDPTTTPPTFTGLAPRYCNTDAPVTLVPNPPGGVFFPSPAMTGNVFDPRLAGNDSITIIYTITDANNCVASSVQGTRVFTAPSVNVGTDRTVCANDAPFVINAQPTGCVWTPAALFTPDGRFNPAAADTGRNELIYTCQSNGCFGRDTLIVNVRPVKVVEIVRSPISPLCEGSPVFLIANVNGSKAGLNYSWCRLNNANVCVPVPNSNKDTLVVTSPGTYRVTVTGQEGCSATSNTDFTVIYNPNPNPIITPNLSNVVACGNQVLSTATAPNRIYRWINANGDTIGTNNSITIAASGIYSVYVKDTITGCFGLSRKDTLIITPKPQVSILGVGDSVCIPINGSITISASSNPSNVTFSWLRNGAPMVPPQNGSLINATQQGRYRVIATSLLNNECRDTSRVVFVGISPISYGDTLIEKCVGDGPFTVVPVDPSCTLRNQSGDPLLNNIFNPTTPGDYIFTYPCRNSANCTSNSTITVRVKPVPSVIIAPLGATVKCVGDTVELFVANPRPDFFYQLQVRPLAGGAFTNVGSAGNTVLFKITTPGVYRVEVTGLGCTNTSNEIEVNFNNTPVVNAGPDISICPTAAGTIQLTPSSGTGGVWTGSPRISPTGLYDYNLFRGCDTVTYTVINAAGCRGEDTRVICVRNEPQITFNITDATSCTDSNGVVTAVLASPGRYRYNWQRIFPAPTITYTLNQSTLSGLKPGNYRVTVFDTTTQCSAQATATVGPVLFNAEIIGLPTTVCSNAQPIPLAGLPLGTSRQFSGIPGSQRVRLINNQFVFDPRLAGPLSPNADSVIYTTLIEGCLGQAKRAIVVTPVPVVNAGLDTAVCSGAIIDLIPETPYPGGFWTGNGVLPDNKFSLNVTVQTNVNVCYNIIPPGCDTVRDCRVITVRPNPSFVTQVIQNVSQCGGSNGIARVDSLNAPQNFNITWFRQNNAIATGLIATNLSVAVYRAVVTNPITGCSAERTAAITGPSNITLNDSCINIQPSYCRVDTPVLLTSNCTADLSNITWTVGGINVTTNPPQFTPSNYPAGPLSIVLRGTDAVGCTVLVARNTTIINNPAVNPPQIIDTICAPFSNVILGGFSPIPGVWGPVSDTLSANGVFNASVAVPKTYNFTYTTGNQCTATGTYKLTVLARPPKPIVTPPSSPSSPLTICDGQSITVTVSNPVTGGRYNWVRRSVPGGPVGNLSNQLVITIAGTYGVTTTVAGCTSEPSDDIVVLSNFTPTITNAGAPIDTCTDGNPIPLSNGITVIGFPQNPTVTVSWSADTQGGTPAACVENGVFNPTCTEQPGTYRAMLIARSGGCADTAYRTIVLHRAATPVLNPIGLVEFCEGSPIPISVTPSAPAAHQPLYRWTVNGSLIPDTGRVLIPTVSGVYRAILSFNGRCPRRAFFGSTVNIKPLPTVQVPGNISLCENDDLFQITNYSPANGIWSSNNCSQVVTPGGVVDPSRVTAPVNCVLYLTASQSGCERKDSITLEIRKAVDVNVTSANGNNTICEGDNIVLTANPADPGNTYQWFFNDTLITGAIGSTFTASRSGRYTVKIESPGQCAGINTRNPFILNVTPPPQITTNDPFSICENGTPVQLFALPDGGTWSGPGIDSRNVFNPANVGEIPPDGIINLTYSINTGCPAQKVLPVRVFDIPVLDVTPETTVEVREPVRLYARGGVSYSWSPASLFTDTALAEQVVQPLVSTTYFAKVTDANGCVQTVSIRINVDDEFKIYDGFSPNGDGINDTWEIKNIRRFPQARVKIYNRWGSLVFESDEGYTKPWDGTKDGKELPAGAYYYNIVLGEGLAPINGSITLLR